MAQIDELCTQIGKFVLKQKEFSLQRTQTMIKQHTEKLSQCGDIVFPTMIQPWLPAIENPTVFAESKQIVDENDAAFVRNLIELSSGWSFPIETVKFQQFRCLLFLNRQKSYRCFLKTVLCDDTYGRWNGDNDAKTIYAVQLVKQLNDKSLVEHRCTLVAKVLANMLRVSGFETLPSAGEYAFDAKNLMEIFVTCARRDGAKRIVRQNDMEFNNNSNAKSKSIVCGSVTARPGLTAHDFIRLRSLDMEKITEMKHGCNKEGIIFEKCRKLGNAIVTFDLLKTKHFNAIDSETLMATTSNNKGAAFILYNVARVHTLLASFDDQVARGLYDPLPEYDQIDFGLLKEEEEWQMFYVYIVGFPTMLERCVSGIENGNIAIHLLCKFLSNLSSQFSVYYHRVKILTDNLPQLTPVMYARIYLLMALRKVYQKSLAILEIEPLDQM